LALTVVAPTPLARKRRRGEGAMFAQASVDAQAGPRARRARIDQWSSESRYLARSPALVPPYFSAKASSALQELSSGPLA
jgi:hypothetical protein